METPEEQLAHESVGRGEAVPPEVVKSLLRMLRWHRATVGQLEVKRDQAVAELDAMTAERDGVRSVLRDFCRAEWDDGGNGSAMRQNAIDALAVLEGQ